MKEIIRLDNIKRDFHVGDETVHALRGVSFTIHEGGVRYDHGNLRLRKEYVAEHAGLP